ncbi:MULTISPECIES: hypothetical protein [unclassified Pseudomonas]|uniref:hypothetical protein n=1 Tax=unclassified Pseudomonas TaxID=196821 RepID=UPI000C88DB5D|nr:MULTISPECIES: hypothetical protein [unclassified Pseudomonas]PMZ92911.1 hypothetical protein C1X79_19055 [Pseudomonas sp. FW305-42]PNA20773.1 hypothetical protein C1X78_20985 [Pseudomonas sp. MPR-R1B]PNB23550.1 hypothetical protein C1X80_18585 [Pseudomonas sp. DP16D-E2]PNB41329.1 hypothetical protein C1X75_20910 [Pseudomonas sp. FW305-17]PNB59468.1 hypothetical protein C1X77_15880 [Pseudomonas sp. GW531-E2]
MGMEELLKATDWQRITNVVKKTYTSHRELYSFKKYPALDYDSFKDTFSALAEKVDLSAALLWKWGHWGKDDFPSKQKALIGEIESLWPAFRGWALSAGDQFTPEATFRWWHKRLGRLRYITSAYLTHLIHPLQVPLIDQHNFRAMNHLRQIPAAKKKPSTWCDIVRLKHFLREASQRFQRQETEFDKYLMMYGRALKPRKVRSSRKEQA